MLEKGDVFGKTREHALGVNYLPYPNIRLRTTFTRREFESGGGRAAADANILQFSGTFSF